MDIKNFAINPEPELIEQIGKFSKAKAFRNCKIRIMADGHAGKGCAVGTVIQYKDKIVPNVVGVDIGCRVSAFKIPVTDIDFEKLDSVIHERVPSGHSIRQQECKDSQRFHYELLQCWYDIKDNEERYRKSMGTLGAGNHFISVEGNYLIIHCGSRNLGLRVANYYQDKAIAARDNRIQKIKENAEVIIKDAASNGDYMGIAGVRFVRDEKIKAEPENDLCYLEGEDMQDYFHDMNMMRDWSFYNHKVIAQEIFDGMGWHDFSDALMTNISSIHNYVDVEHSIIRKGAIDMSDGKLGIIPLNMASGSLLVRGKGNQDYLCSGPHGAGRIMSRKKARLSVDMDDYHKVMNGIYTTSVCYDTLDEAPQAYKDADTIVAAIEPTAKIIAHLRPRYNFKAKG